MWVKSASRISLGDRIKRSWLKIQQMPLLIRLFIFLGLVCLFAVYRLGSSSGEIKIYENIVYDGTKEVEIKQVVNTQPIHEYNLTVDGFDTTTNIDTGNEQKSEDVEKEGFENTSNENDDVNENNEQQMNQAVADTNNDNDNEQKVEEKKEEGFALTRSKLVSVRKAATELIDMLDEYYSVYNGGAKNMLAGLGGWARDWDIDDSNDVRADKIGDKLTDTMVRALMDPEQESFIVGIIGSSVAAGHDNCRYDNYEKQLHRTFKSVWDAAGMTLQVQNAAERGECGDSYANQVWCVTQNVSPFADIVHYVWTYFESGDGDGARKARESLIRWAHLLKKQPPVHVLHVGNARDGFPSFNADEEKLHNKYSSSNEYAYNAFYLKKSFTSGMHDDKKDTTATQIFQGHHVGDGYHFTTRYGENETNSDRKDSLGVVYRNWHPGPLGFQLISDAFAYVYTKHVLLALDEIENSFRNDSNIGATTDTIPDRRRWEHKRPIVLKNDMGPPLFCDPTYCAVDTAPTCTNYEFPVFGWYGASIPEEDDELNPFKTELEQHTGEQEKWKRYIQEVDRTEYFIPKLEQQLYGESNPEFCKFDDTCGAMKSKTVEQGRLVFKLPKLEVGVVIVCGCCGKDVATSMFLNNLSLEINFNGQILNRTKYEIFPNGKCARIIKEPNGLSVGSTGHSYLSFRILEDSSIAAAAITPISISQIMTL